MRGRVAVLAVAAVMALGGCTAGTDVPPTENRSGPATLAPEDLGDDVVDLATVQDQIDDLRLGLDDTEQEARRPAEDALDRAQAALDEAGPVREGGTQEQKTAAAGTVEEAVDALEATRAETSDAFGRALDVLDGQLRRLAEELRRAPAPVD